MGAVPSITLTLVSASPYRLRYLMVGDGGSNGTILPNAAGVTPDLRTDAATALFGNGRTPILEVVSTAVVNDAQAEAVLQSLRASAAPFIGSGLLCESRAVPRPDFTIGEFPSPWRVQAAEGGGAGDPASTGFSVFFLVPPGDHADESAYLDIHVGHTDRVGFPNPPSADGGP